MILIFVFELTCLTLVYNIFQISIALFDFKLKNLCDSSESKFPVTVLPYPSANFFAEVIMLLLIAGIEYVRLFLGKNLAWTSYRACHYPSTGPTQYLKSTA